MALSFSARLDDPSTNLARVTLARRNLLASISMSMAKNVDETSVLGCLAALLKNFDHVKSGNCVTSRRKSSNLAGNSFEALSHQPKRTKATKKETLFTSVALAKIVGSPC